MTGDKYDLCNDCTHCTWDCYEGHSAKECGLPNAKEWFIDGCKEDCEPYYDEDQECWTCNSYEMQESEENNMTKLEETNGIIDFFTRLAEKGIHTDNMQVTVLLDIAKSLAMIADKLCEVEE